MDQSEMTRGLCVSRMFDGGGRSERARTTRADAADRTEAALAHASAVRAFTARTDYQPKHRAELAAS